MKMHQKSIILLKVFKHVIILDTEFSILRIGDKYDLCSLGRISFFSTSFDIISYLICIAIFLIANLKNQKYFL